MIGIWLFYHVIIIIIIFILFCKHFDMTTTDTSTSATLEIAI